MLSLPQTHKVTIFKDVTVYIDYAAGCGSITGAVTYVPPGRLTNVKFELKVTKAVRCFGPCYDMDPIACNAKVDGTAFINDAEVPIIFLEVPEPSWWVTYEGNTPYLPHIVKVAFCKNVAGDLGAYWITFDLVLTYTYEVQGTLSVRAFRDGLEVSAWCEIEGVTSGYTPFYLDVDPGVYTVNCTYEEETQTKTVEVYEGELTEVNFRFEVPPSPTIWVHLRCEGVVTAQCVVVHDPYSDTITVPTDFTVSPAGDWTFRALGEDFEYWIVDGVRMDAREITLTLEEPSSTTLTMYFKGAVPPLPIPDILTLLGAIAAVISIGGVIYHVWTYFKE